MKSRTLSCIMTFLMTLTISGRMSAQIVPKNPTPEAGLLIPRYAYVTNRVGNNVSAFRVNPGRGTLSPVANSPFVTGAAPISVVADPKGHFLYVADLGSFQVSAYRIDRRSGSLSAIPGSPFNAGENPQFLTTDKSGKFLYVLDTFFSPNQNGQIEVFSIDSGTGTITPISDSPVAAGMLPVSIAFARNGELAYVADIGSNQVLGYSVNSSTGTLTPLPGSPYPTDIFPVSVATDDVSSSVYVANQSNDISAYHITSTGDLTPLPGSPYPSGGVIPLSIAVDRKHLVAYVLNDVSANVTGFRINPKSGVLTQIAGSFPTGAAPVQLVVDASSKFAYVVDSGSQDISVYRIHKNGELTEIEGSPFPAPGPSSIALTGVRP